MLADLLERHRISIEGSLSLGYTRWEKLVASVRRAEEENLADFYDETAWTFLVDISATVSHDWHRNQLARVIENALYCRAADGTFPQEAHVTLVTPGVFRRERPWSRLYPYKWEEYQDPARIQADLDACRLPKRAGLPPLAERIGALRLHWVTFEELFGGAPVSSLREPIQAMFENRRGEQLREAP